MGNQPGNPETGTLNDRTAWTSEAKFWYSLLPSVKSGKYRETEGIKDYTSPGNAIIDDATQDEVNAGDFNFQALVRDSRPHTVTDTIKIQVREASMTKAKMENYDLVDASTAPASYKRVFTRNGTESKFPYVMNNSGSVTEYDDGSKEYAFSALQYTTVSRPANPTRVTSISFRSARDIKRGEDVTLSVLHRYPNLYDCTTWDNYYVPVGFYTVGSVRVNPVTIDKYTAKAIKPAEMTQAVLTPAATVDQQIYYGKVRRTEAAHDTKTFLVQHGIAQPQSIDDIE